MELTKTAEMYKLEVNERGRKYIRTQEIAYSQTQIKLLAKMDNSEGNFRFTRSEDFSFQISKFKIL